MKLYIQTENNRALNHPAFEHNLLQAFGSIPDTWEPFTRVERPVLGIYELLESDPPVYDRVDGVWTDLWNVREMTTEEKIAKQQAVITAFNVRPQAENWSAWTLDEATCTMQPPIPRPEANLNPHIMTAWCGADNNWKDMPVRPEGEYKFDFLAWQWLVV